MMTAADFNAWLSRLGYSQRDAAKALGCARQTISGYASGETTIPHYIALACAAVAQGLPAIGANPKAPD